MSKILFTVFCILYLLAMIQFYRLNNKIDKKLNSATGFPTDKIKMLLFLLWWPFLIFVAYAELIDLFPDLEDDPK